MAHYEALYGRLTERASDRQKSYANLKRKNIEYSIGDFVFLKVSPRTTLPPELNRIHDVLHVSMLRCYHSDPTHIFPVEEIEVSPDLTFEEKPIQILDCDIKVLLRKVKVLWQKHST
ncbi:uncharacterized protein LOC108474126 [Gossypium arboreum]|uniref:uncharacterized protein LOC108474126 n=1 Tax=Gossypium arboreum TaxID=29729 RepID=UPI000819463D|nr:uncharacterized protein LOC108474126 [Gossypium arboreum]